MARDFRAVLGGLADRGAEAGRDGVDPAGRGDLAELVVGRDLAGGDQLDLVPGDPVRRLAPEPGHPEPAVEAGGLVDRPGPADVGEGVDPPGLGGDLQLIEAVEQPAGLPLVEQLGPEPRDPGDPLHGVGRDGRR